MAANVDKEKNIAFLLNELDVLRANNKKLQDQLSEKDKELKTIKLDLELRERVAEAKIAEKAAALVEEIHSARHEHDEAIMARLKLASEERNDACKQVKLLEQPLGTLENINPEENDMTLQELLNRINNADTGMAIWRTGAIIVDRIYRTQERKKKITAEEINALIEERDGALAQCKRLEQELHHMKEQNQTSANKPRHLTAENNQERALKEKLFAMQQEREAAVHQYKNLEEELQTLRIYYSPTYTSHLWSQALNQHQILMQNHCHPIPVLEIVATEVAKTLKDRSPIGELPHPCPTRGANRSRKFAHAEIKPANVVI
ncbi:mirror-image polydactyly gene 1 protein isoform 2-T4 [Liasis olivaceus]